MAQTSPEDLEKKGLENNQEVEPEKNNLKCPKTWGW
jgi:hypothetical protein